MKALGGVDGILARHGVHHHEKLRRRRGSSDLLQLLHHLVVYLQPAPGIQNDPCCPSVLSLLHPLPTRIQRAGPLAFAVHGHVQLLTQGHQLLDRGRTAEVSRNQQHPVAPALEMEASLAAVVVFPDPCNPASIKTDGGESELASLETRLRGWQ